MTMSGTHTETVLNKLTKPELVQLFLKTESILDEQVIDLTNGVKDTLTHLKKLEGDIAAVRIVTNRLVERLVKTYSVPDETMEIVGILDSVDNSVLEETVCGVFKQIFVEIGKRNVQACYRLEKKERTTVKFVNRKDCL